MSEANVTDGGAPELMERDEGAACVAKGGGKVFGIGLSRTGTKSLHEALGLLGYRSLHYPPLHDLEALLESHDAATDTPVACMFRELDERYPGSKFILTVRDFRSWLASTRMIFARELPVEEWKREVRLRTYGVLEWERGAFLNAYHRHIEAVMDYFAERPEQLMIMDIIGGEGWDLLCRFLGAPAPDAAFPHANELSRKRRAEVDEDTVKGGEEDVVLCGNG